MDTLKHFVKRNSLRVRPGALEQVAQASFNFEAELFRPEFIGSVLNESMGGCCIVLVNGPYVSSGDNILVHTARKGLSRAKVVWVNIIDNEVTKIGVKFLS